MAADATRTAHRFGSVYDAVDSLNTQASALFKGYEEDEPVVALAQRAMDIRVAAHRLEQALDAIVGALDNLNE